MVRIGAVVVNGENRANSFFVWMNVIKRCLLFSLSGKLLLLTILCDAFCLCLFVGVIRVGPLQVVNSLQVTVKVKKPV